MYCSRECAGLKRRQSLRRAGSRYQKTFRGARLHAARQVGYRRRLSEEVTHHGSPINASYVIVNPGNVLLGSEIGTNGAVVQVSCGICGCPCGPFARFAAWRRGWGGIGEAQLRHDDIKGARGGDSAALPC